MKNEELGFGGIISDCEIKNQPSIIFILGIIFFNQGFISPLFMGVYSVGEENYGNDLLWKGLEPVSAAEGGSSNCLSGSEFCCGPAQAYRVLALEYQLLE